MDSKGYEFVLAGQDIKEFQCSLCKLLLREAMELPCTHLNCQSCLWNWQMDPKAKAGTSIDNDNEFYHCPTCHAPYSLDQMRRSTVSDRVITNSLEVKCLFHRDGCKWQGTITKFQDHKVVCDFTPSNCPFDGCHELLNSVEMKKHIKNCPHKPAGGSQDGGEKKIFSSETDMVTANDVDTPEEILARKKRLEEFVFCPMLTCETKIPYKSLTEHLKACKKTTRFDFMIKELEEETQKASRSYRFSVSEYNDKKEKIKLNKRKIEDYEEKLRMVKNEVVIETKEETRKCISKPANQNKAYEKFCLLIKSNDLVGLSDLLHVYPDVAQLTDERYHNLVSIIVRSETYDTRMLLLLLEHAQKHDSFHRACIESGENRNRQSRQLTMVRALMFYDENVLDTEGESLLHLAFDWRNDDLFTFLINQPNIDVNQLDGQGKKVDQRSHFSKTMKQSIQLKRRLGEKSLFQKLGF